MKKHFVALVCLSLLSTSVPAVTVLGGGSCGQWISDRKSNKMMSATKEFWLLGYISGLAAATDKDVLKGMDSNSMEAWIDNYCGNNPLDRFVNAADALFIELVKRTK